MELRENSSLVLFVGLCSFDNGYHHMQAVFLRFSGRRFSQQSCRVDIRAASTDIVLSQNVGLHLTTYDGFLFDKVILKVTVGFERKYHGTCFSLQLSLDFSMAICALIKCILCNSLGIQSESYTHFPTL